MRILWVSNASWVPTGYGNQTKVTLPALQALGHNVGLFAYYGLDGAIVDMGGMIVYPSGTVPWGNDLVRAHAQQHKADLVISLMDVWVQEFWNDRFAEIGMRFAPWTPIDMTPVPEKIVERLRGVTSIIAMSRYGEAQLRQAGFDNVVYIPHAVDVNVFRPLDQAECRRALGIADDRFVIGMVAANTGRPSRKAIPEQILAFSKFRAQNPAAKPLIWLHMLKGHPAHDGIDIGPLLDNLGLVEGEDVVFSDQYRLSVGFNEQQMVQLYNAFDVLSAASLGEGFGLPILEAQACGTPVVCSDNTTGPELCMGGRLVKRMHPFWARLNAWVSVPDVDELAEHYAELYDTLRTTHRGTELQFDAHEGAQQYDIRRIVQEHWQPWLEDVCP